jgi:general secretion pathway protein H
VTVRVDQEPVRYVRPLTSGFTLIELLAVLFILALVAAVVVPSLGGGEVLELKSAARSLAAGLRHTRNRALNDNSSAAFAVDVAKREFQLPDEKRVRKLPERIDIRLFMARSERQSEERGAIRFFPDGSSTGGRITLSIDDARYLVDVDWLTGRVRIIESVVEEAAGR